MTRTVDPLKPLAAEVDELTEDAYRRRRGTDLARITTAVREQAPADRRILPSRRRRTVPILAGVAAAAVAAGVIAVPAVTSGPAKSHGPVKGHGPVTPPRALDAKSILLASADITAKKPAAAHGNYWYSQIRVVERARQPRKGGPVPRGASANGFPRSGSYYPFHAYVTITWENWDPYHQGQPSRTVDRDITTSFATPADKAAWQRAGSPSLTDMKPFSADSHYDEPYLETVGPSGTKMADLAKLPDTVAGLEKQVRAFWSKNYRVLKKLHAEKQQTPYTENVVEAAISIITSPTTPKVRAAAYRMLAAQPGIRSIGGVRDRLGRPGVALVVPATKGFGPRVEEHLIIDPESAQILATEDYPVGKDGKAESEPSSSTLRVGDGWTDRIGAPARG